MPTYYEILDVASNASVGQIRDALQKEEIRLSLILDRPDEGGRVEAERRVVVLSTVEQTLLDANARANYDRQLARIPTARAASSVELSCEALVAHSRAVLLDGRASDALTFAKSAVAADGRSADAWTLMGLASQTQGDHEGAVVAYRRAISLRPGDDDIHSALGLCLAEMGRHGEAIEEFKKAEEISPQATHSTDLGLSLIAIGQSDDGLALIERAAAEYPDDPESQVRLARAYHQAAFLHWSTGPEAGDTNKYAISYEQAAFARTMVERALALKFDDKALRESLEQDRALVHENFKLQYCGAKVQPAIAFVMGALAFTSGNSEGIGPSLWLTLGSVLYVVSWFLPRYINNREFVLGHPAYDDFGWARRFRTMLPDNLFGMFAGLALATIVLVMIPVFGIYNLYRFHGDSIRRWLIAQRDGSGSLAGIVKSVQHGYTRVRASASESASRPTKEAHKAPDAPPQERTDVPVVAANSPSVRTDQEARFAAFGAGAAAFTAGVSRLPMMQNVTERGRLIAGRFVRAKLMLFGLISIVLVAVLWMSLGSGRRTDNPIADQAATDLSATRATSPGANTVAMPVPQSQQGGDIGLAKRPQSIDSGNRTDSSDTVQASALGFALDGRSGCQVFKPGVAAANESVEWQGPCTAGFANGPGRAVWLVDGRENIVYVGTFRKGRLEGRGSMDTAQGDRYEGSYHLGMREGQGIYTSPSGARYEGGFLQNKRNGRGTLTLADGSRQQGTFLAGKFVGP